MMARRFFGAAMLLVLFVAFTLSAQFDGGPKSGEGKAKKDFEGFFDGGPKSGEGKAKKDFEGFKEKKGYEDEAGKMSRILEKESKAPETEREKVVKEISKLLSDGELLTDDSGKWFDLLAGTGDEWNRRQIESKPLGEIFDRIAGRLDISGDSIRRGEFRSYADKYLTPFGSPFWKLPKEIDYGGEAEKMFRQLDRNGDGVLSVDEMTDALRSEKDRWDTDRDGSISLEEYKAYFLGRLKKIRTERVPAPSPEVEETANRVHRAGKLPKELPPWFDQMDVDRDGQIGLYEWRRVWPIAEFRELDTNDDGYITPEEMLKHIRNLSWPPLVTQVMQRQLSPSDLRALSLAFSGEGRQRGPKQKSGTRDLVTDLRAPRPASASEVLPPPKATDR